MQIYINLFIIQILQHYRFVKKSKAGIALIYAMLKNS